MVTHFWLLPWPVLVVGASALTVGSGAGHAALRLSSPTLPHSFYAVWPAATLFLGVAMVRLGKTAHLTIDGKD